MPERQIDPARLEGEALQRWYLRSPDQIEREREASQAQRYQAFFGAEPSGSGQGAESSRPPTSQMASPDADVLWIANGRGGYRAVRGGGTDFQAALQPPPGRDHPDYLPENSAAEEDGRFLDIGNPHNRRLKKEYIKEHGSWPQTPDGRNFHVAHIKATGDGGSQTLDNIRPQDPDEHMAEHRANGDNARFGKRPGIARAFGGKVEPPRMPKIKVPRIRGVGPLGTALNPEPLLTGQVRTDSFPNFALDMLGLPSLEEYRRGWEGPKWTTPDCPPGWQCI